MKQKVIETAFLFDRRSWQNKFGAAEEPVHKDTGAVGQTSLRMEAQAGYYPECTVEPWEGLCQPWSPSLQLVKGAGGEHSLCVLYHLIEDSQMQGAVLAITDLPIQPFISSFHGNMKVLLTSLGVHSCGQRMGACWKGGNWWNSALKILQTELG